MNDQNIKVLNPEQGKPAPVTGVQSQRALEGSESLIQMLMDRATQSPRARRAVEIQAGVRRVAQTLKERCWYEWDILKKDQSGKVMRDSKGNAIVDAHIEGESYEAAAALVPIYGNLLIDSTVDDQGDSYKVRAVSVDLESNAIFRREGLYYKARKGRGGMAGGRFDEMTQQIAQSKLLRKLIGDVMKGSGVLEQLVDLAKVATTKDWTPEVLQSQKAKAIAAFQDFEVTVAMLEWYLSKPHISWKTAEIRTLVGLKNALAEKETTASEVFAGYSSENEKATQTPTTEGRPSTAAPQSGTEAVAAPAEGSAAKATHKSKDSVAKTSAAAEPAKAEKESPAEPTVLREIQQLLNTLHPASPADWARIIEDYSAKYAPLIQPPCKSIAMLKAHGTLAGNILADLKPKESGQ